MEKFFYTSRDGSIKLILSIPESVYHPDEDSLLMAGVLENIGNRLEDSRFLEIGCGSGFLSILAARLGAVVFAADINPSAVEATEENAARSGADVNASMSNMFGNVKGEFDFIIFNAPYLPDKDEKIRGREQWSMHQGGNIIKNFIKESKKHLASDGNVLLLFSSLSGDVESILKKNSFAFEIIARKKLDFEEIIIAKCWKMQ